MRKSFAPHPADLTSFVGRHEDVTRLTESFARGARLVTVFGPAGIGKTRLSRKVLEQTSEDVAGYFCDLQAAASQQDLCVALATALGVGVPETDDVAGDLGRALDAHGPCRVVFDNFEQLVDSRETLEGWLMQAPGTCFLVTSRRLLRLGCEVAYELSPLPVEPTDEESLSDAAQLFLERARSIEPSLVLDADARRDVDRLVKQLEGLPLAIELAAASVRRVGPAELLRELKASRLDLRDDRQRSERHRSLRIAMEQSWRLLTPTEQAALAQLSVFRGGFDRDAVEDVLQLGAPRNSHRLDVIARLREASWLRVTSTNSMRWNLYEAVRAFAREKLDESSRTHEVRESHASHFLERGRGLTEAITGGTPHAKLSHDIENLQAAFRWYVESEQDEPTASCALILHRLFRQHMPAAAADAVNLVIEQGAPRASAWRLYLARAECRRRTGRYSEAEEDLEHAKRTCGLSDGARIEIDLERGLLAFERGNTPEALAILVDARQRTEGTGTPTQIAGNVLSALAWVKAEMYRDRTCFGLWDHAAQTLDDVGATEAAAQARVLSHGYRISITNEELTPGQIEHLHAASVSGSGDLKCQALLFLSWTAARNTEFVTAEGFATRCRNLARRAGHRFWEAGACFYLGLLREQRADFHGAIEMYRWGADTSKAIRNHRLRSWIQLGYCGVLARSGDVERAQEQLQHVDQTRATDDPMINALHDLQSCRLALVRAQQGIASGKLDEAARECRPAHRLLASSRAVTNDTTQPTTTAEWIERDLSARVWLCCLERELGEIADTLPVLRIWRDGQAFSIAYTSTVRVPDAPILRRVLSTLAEQREERPGGTLSTDELFQRGWPTSNIAAPSRAKRVWNVVVRLRRLGLQDVLCRSKAGYFLDPNVPIEVVDPHPGGVI